MQIAIVDDVPDDRLSLLEVISDYAKENELPVQFCQFSSGEEFLKNASQCSPDVVFLDIYMGELNGMDVAHKLKELVPSCKIVFVTSTSDFAVESYEVRAFFYLLKPFSKSDICSVMSLIEKSAKHTQRYIKVKEVREWKRILLSDIIYVDYRNHYVQIHLENKIVRTYMKFAEIEEKLLIYSEFLNCYRCIIVNINKIKKQDDLFFLLCNDEYIPINRKNAKEIKSQYTEYVFSALEKGELEVGLIY